MIQPRTATPQAAPQTTTRIAPETAPQAGVGNTPSAVRRFLRAFSDHPASIGETYLEHCRFALGFAGVLFVAALAATVHALLPGCCQTAASRAVMRLSARMERRMERGGGGPHGGPHGGPRETAPVA